MSGKYTFYVRAHTTGSLVESIYNFPITTNAPSLTFSSAITLYGKAETSAIAHLIVSPSFPIDNIYTFGLAYFSKIHTMSGSWVGEITFIPYGDSNSNPAGGVEHSISGSWVGEITFVPYGDSNAG